MDFAQTKLTKKEWESIEAQVSMDEKEILKKKKDIFKVYKNKRDRMLRIHNLKPRCIHCTRNVGTNFEKISGVYRASCGDSTDPCKLNIEINAGYHTNIVNQIGLTLDFINLSLIHI